MGDKKIKPSCESCEFNFGAVCVGHGIRKDNKEGTYGSPIDEVKKMFPSGCEDWGISLDAFIRQEKMNGR